MSPVHAEVAGVELEHVRPVVVDIEQRVTGFATSVALSSGSASMLAPWQSSYMRGNANP